MKKSLLFLFLIVFLVSCGKVQHRNSIAKDSYWYGIALNGQTNLVNGFINDVLIEISKIKNIEIEIVEVNWNNIIWELESQNVAAAFTSMDKFNFNLDKYDFSNDILKTGYSLIQRKNTNFQSLNEMKNKHVGYIRGERSEFLIDQTQDVYGEVYDFIPDMLKDLENDRIEAAILSVIPAYKYVSDLYEETLKINFSDPITDQSIKIMTLKNQNNEFLKILNSGLEDLEKSGKLKDLKIKWGLPN
ncbi:MAG: transporter substrate-binding domain-containing protein [Parachlamydiales bacterium]|nr:transporter substrate-binding domain-containing protein [Parachlamydiales bacterium]